MPEKDYSEYRDKAPTDQSVSTLARMGEALVDAEMGVLVAENELKKAQALKRDVEERMIPDAMREAGVEELKLTGGVVIALDEILCVTPKKENRHHVLNWLEKEGHGALIKRTISVAFTREQQAEADNLVKLLVEEHHMSTKEERKVESQTLKKHVKGLLEEGASLPMDILGVYQFTRALITKGKPKLVFKDER